MDKRDYTIDINGVLRINEGVTEIEAEAFEGDLSIKKVILPATVSEIGVSAFEYCETLREIVFSENLIKIAERAFMGTAVEKLVFPDSLCALEGQAFSRCKNLREVTFGSNINRIADLAFSFSDVKSVVIPDSQTEVWHTAFFGCSRLEYLESGRLDFYAAQKVYSGDHIVCAFIAGCVHRGRRLPDNVARLVNERGIDFAELFIKNNRYSCAAYLIRNALVSKNDAERLLKKSDSAELSGAIIEYLHTLADGGKLEL